MIDQQLEDRTRNNIDVAIRMLKLAMNAVVPSNISHYNDSVNEWKATYKVLESVRAQTGYILNDIRYNGGIEDIDNKEDTKGGALE